jgi:hypothetical protein
VPPKPELGKYQLWRLFHQNQKIRPYLPPTALYSHRELTTFLNKYRDVYVKPSGGSMGRGIMKVWKQGQSVYVHHTTQKSRVFASLSEAEKYIDKQRNGKHYIVQKGIPLAQVHHRPYDIRVMMQKEKPGGAWLYSGMIAKVAGAGSVVTNVALSRGSVLTVEAALRQSLGLREEKIKALVLEMQQLARRAAQHFDTYQPYREIGFDVAVDRRARLWMIEQNTGPSHPLFKRLKSNPELYQTIQRRWAAYQKYLKKR